MGKKRDVKIFSEDDEHDDENDFFMLDDMCEDEVVSRMVGYMTEASKYQMEIALKLTKLITENDENIKNEAAIMTTFKKSLSLVCELSPLQKLLEQMQ